VLTGWGLTAAAVIGAGLVLAWRKPEDRSAN
jgi:hypothetical protein